MTQNQSSDASSLKNTGDPDRDQQLPFHLTLSTQTTDNDHSPKQTSSLSTPISPNISFHSPHISSEYPSTSSSQPVSRGSLHSPWSPLFSSVPNEQYLHPQNFGTIVVKNLPAGTHNSHIQRHFSQFGKIKEIRATPHRDSHRFIEYEQLSDAAKAQEFSHKTLFMGHSITVEFSRPGGWRKKALAAQMKNMPSSGLNPDLASNHTPNPSKHKGGMRGRKPKATTHTEPNLTSPYVLSVDYRHVEPGAKSGASQPQLTLPSLSPPSASFATDLSLPLPFLDCLFSHSDTSPLFRDIPLINSSAQFSRDADDHGQVLMLFDTNNDLSFTPQQDRLLKVVLDTTEFLYSPQCASDLESVRSSVSSLNFSYLLYSGCILRRMMIAPS